MPDCAVCLEEENQEKIQEMVRMYKKGPISLDPRFITLRHKIGSGFFGDVFLATIPLRASQPHPRPLPTHPSSSLSPAASSAAAAASDADAAAANHGANNNIANYIQVAVKVLKDSSLFNSRVSPGM